MTPDSDGDGEAAVDPDVSFRERRGRAAPSVSNARPDAGGLDAAEADEVLLRTFWGCVIAVNVAMAAIPLGLLLIHFRGDWDLGGLAIAVGAVAAVAAVRFYLIFRADRREDEGAVS